MMSCEHALPYFAIGMLHSLSGGFETLHASRQGDCQGQLGIFSNRPSTSSEASLGRRLLTCAVPWGAVYDL